MSPSGSTRQISTRTPSAFGGRSSGQKPGGSLYRVRHAQLKHRQEGEWRDVPLPESLATIAPCFPVLTEAGTIPYPDLFRRSWNRAIKRLGLPPYTPHDLRHKWATVTLTNGVALHEVSRWLGHRSIKVTVDLYGHLTHDGLQRCRQVVNTVYAEYVPRVSTARTSAERGADLVLA